jgi:hypothetical protein
MSASFWVTISPLIGGTILILVCFVAILRNPGVSNTFAVLLAFGALLFVIPALSAFNFKGWGVEFSGQAATAGQVNEQAAAINARLEDVKTALADLSRRVAPTVPAAAAPTPEFGANRSSTVVVIYPADPKAKALAKQMETELLKKGYQATSVYSDYSELADSRKGPPGSARYIYNDATKQVAGSVKQLLAQDLGERTLLPDDVRPQTSADVQLLLF